MGVGGLVMMLMLATDWLSTPASLDDSCFLLCRFHVAPISFPHIFSFFVSILLHLRFSLDVSLLFFELYLNASS